MKILCIDLWKFGDLKTGKHPGEYLRENLGLRVERYEGAPIQDSVYVLVDKLPIPMPDFLIETPNHKFL